MRSRAPNVVAAVSVAKAAVASAASVVKAAVASVANVAKAVVVKDVVSAANVVKGRAPRRDDASARAAMTQPVAVASVAMRNQRRPLA
ncbi:Uncharacterised protein [Klebsiella pneumoniae]|uniref:Secreted protein n=1 Tax=Klebsiella pneumoniae TaxID=573 RepID=A0A2X3CC48_KLEPN|nr:Uncharacterised protein [Klebsiella pneumoniae]